MRLRLQKPAEWEIHDAVQWYDKQVKGLGRNFLDDLDRALRRIITFPESSPEIDPEIRRCLLSRFPYGVIYGIDGDMIVVVAVAHSHREPKYWIDRIDDFSS